MTEELKQRYISDWKETDEEFAKQYQIKFSSFIGWLRDNKTYEPAVWAIKRWLKNINKIKPSLELLRNISKVPTIRLDSFINALDQLPSYIDHLIFIDGDQVHLKDLGWIFNDYYKDNLLANFKVFYTTNKANTLPLHLYNYDWMIHVQSSSNFENAADYTICAQMNQAIIYSRMKNFGFKYTIISHDLFIFPVQADAITMGQYIDVIDEVSNRLDLYFITLLNYNQLSNGAQYIKSLIDELFEFRNNIDVNITKEYYPEIPTNLTNFQLKIEVYRLLYNLKNFESH